MLAEDERRLLEVLGQASTLQLYRLQLMLGRMLGDPKRIIEVRRHLNLGQAVRYFDSASGQMRPATVVALKDREVVVQDHASRQQWKLAYAAIEPPAPGEGAAQAPEAEAPQPAKPKREDFQRGQKVSFEDRHLRTQVGVITRINQRTASIDTGDGTWKVSFGLLRHVLDV